MHISLLFITSKLGNITDGEKNVAPGDFTVTITFDRQMELWSRHTWQAVCRKRWQQIDRKNHLFRDWQMRKDIVFLHKVK